MVAWLLPAAFLTQVFFVGLSLFTGQALWGTHRDFGHTLGVFPLLLLILAYLGRVPRQDTLLVWLQFGVYLVQAEVFAAIRDSIPFLAAFHPVLALVLFALALMVALRAVRVVRARVQTSSTTPQHAPLEKKGSLAPDANQERTDPLLCGSRFSLAARRTFVLSRQPLGGNKARQRCHRMANRQIDPRNYGRVQSPREA
jgi:hypothetical protein